MSHDHDHDHDCQHDHDHDTDEQEATVEDLAGHLVLSFCHLALPQVDFEAINDDEGLQKRLFLLIFGAVQAFADADDLTPDQVLSITANVLGELFPWEDNEVEACCQELMAAKADPASQAVILEGKDAMESAMEAASRLGEFLAT